MPAAMKGIPCPHCGTTTSDIVDSRPNEGRIRRRRRCTSYGQRFTTHELVIRHDTHANGFTEELCAKLFGVLGYQIYGAYLKYKDK